LTAPQADSGRHTLAEAMCKSAGAAPGAGGARGGDGQQQLGGESKPKENVVDAGFVDVDDKK
jgi:hypothetical protein